MARDNRKDNRANAKAGNENKAPAGTDLTDLLAQDIDGVEEEDVQNFDTKEEAETEDDNNNENENANEGEADKKVATTGVDKGKAEEEGKTVEEVAKAKEPKAEEVAKGEKTAEELAAEKATEPTDKKPEPTAEELAAKVAEDKAKADADAKAETPKTLSNEEADALFKDWRSTTETLLAEHHYKLTEEDVAQLNENPAAYIPRAMSRVYLDTISATFQQFVNYIPRMVHQVLEIREQNSVQENSFFTSWPDLKEHKDTVLRLGAAYRQSNPSASQEDFINEVGAQAMVALRLTPVKANGNGKAHVEANANTNVAEKPFKPASGNTGEVPRSNKPLNPFDQLIQDFAAAEEEVDDS